MIAMRATGKKLFLRIDEWTIWNGEYPVPTEPVIHLRLDVADSLRSWATRDP